MKLVNVETIFSFFFVNEKVSVVLKSNMQVKTDTGHEIKNNGSLYNGVVQVLSATLAHFKRNFC